MLNFVLKYLLKRSPLSKRRGGFTLVELLVTIVISSIVLGVLLTFLNLILESERRERAKSMTEQETQEAVDYIANDLQEAVYVYDAEGIGEVKDQLLYSDDATRVPVLVFWKRTFLPRNREVTNLSGEETSVGCLVRLPNNNCDLRDYFVYSLVVYYLIKDSNSIWSTAARIGRWEIQDGIKDPYNSSNYLTSADPGFKLFDLSLPGSLTDKMKAWTKSSSAYAGSNTPRTLIDYVDHSIGTGVLTPVGCSNTSSMAQRVPADGDSANPLQIYSFYACVDASRTSARVYLRGNALARINPGATYTSNQEIYFPTASVQVQSQGLIDGK